MSQKKEWTYFMLCLCLSITFLGCDVISSIKQYFYKSDHQVVSSPDKRPPNSSDRIPLMTADTLARVGTWSITINDFEDKLRAIKEMVPDYDMDDVNAKKTVLEELINQRLLVMGAKQTGLDKQEAIISAVEEFRNTRIVRETVKNLTENIEVTDEEARAFYEEKKDVLKEPEQWHVRELVVKEQLKANEILVEILKSGNFAELAKQHSVSKTASQGGDLGFITQEPFPAMANAILSLEVGGVSSVFKGPEGHYIIKLEEKKGGGQIQSIKYVHSFFWDMLLLLSKN